MSVSNAPIFNLINCLAHKSFSAEALHFEQSLFGSGNEIRIYCKILLFLRVSLFKVPTKEKKKE